MGMDIEWMFGEDFDPYLLQRLFYVERYAWLSLSPDMCAVISLDGQFEDVNTHWEEPTGISREDLQGDYLMEHIHFDDRERVLAEMQELITSDIASTTFSFRFRTNGDHHIKLNWNVIFSPDHNAYFCTVHDPERDKSAAKLAYRDTLTGLRNRLSLEESLPRIFEDAMEADSKVAILFIDLDGFKAVNDSLGHKAGDTLLVRSARRMKHVVGRKGTAYRQGGDEFIVVMPKASDRDMVAAMAGQMVEKLRFTFEMEGGCHHTGASMGIAIYPTDGDTPEKICEAADKAMYRVKKGGKNNFIFYDKAWESQ